MDIKTIAKHITSRTNPFIISVAALQDKKARERQGLFVFEGIKLFEEALNAGFAVEHLIISESAAEKYNSRLSTPDPKLHSKTLLVSDPVYAKLTSERSPQGIMCVCKMSSCTWITRKVPEEPANLSIILHNLSDPGNVGTIIRTADALGCFDIYLSDSCADVFGHGVIRGAMGALFRQRIILTGDTAALISSLKARGVSVHAAAAGSSSQSLYEAGLSEPYAVIFGNEGNGIPRGITALCDKSLKIPMKEHAESLNAAVAASIFMAHAVKG